MQIVDSLAKNGLVATRFEIIVLELVPGYYVLLDGAHRLCAWKCMVAANKKLEKVEITATVLSSNMSWEQVEIVAGGQNGLVSIVPSFLDLVSVLQFVVSN